MEKLSYEEFKNQYSMQAAEDSIDDMNATYSISLTLEALADMTEQVIKSEYETYLNIQNCSLAD
jgi:hypothetical protein